MLPRPVKLGSPVKVTEFNPPDAENPTNSPLWLLPLISSTVFPEIDSKSYAATNPSVAEDTVFELLSVAISADDNAFL